MQRALWFEKVTSNITTVFIDHKDATCDLFQQGDKEGRESTLAEETQYSREVSYYLFRNGQFNFRNWETKKGSSTYWSTDCLFVRPSILAEYFCDLCIGIVELSVVAAICAALARLGVRAKRILSFLLDMLFVTYVVHVVWSWSLWNDFAAGTPGYLQHNGRGHLEQLVAHVIRKWCHC
jgi:hypothetical protein